MKQKLYYGIFVILTALLLLCGYLFEKPYGERSYLLAGISAIYLLILVLHFVWRKNSLHSITLLSLILFLVTLEFSSKYAVNYFYHSLYLLNLVLIILRSDRRRGLILSVLLSVCSFIKFVELLIIQPSTGNIAMSIFLAITQLLLILVFTLYKIYHEESVRNKELYEELLITHLQLKQYSEEMKHLAKLQERNNIARDLHDTLGHELTGLIMQMEMTSRLIEQDYEKGKAVLEEAKASARGSLSQVRTIVDTLKNDEELAWTHSSIKELIEHFVEMTDVHIDYTVDGEGLASPDIGLTLYRLVQEALTNAVRHGKAFKVSVRIDYQPTQVDFEVRDNGKGCPNPSYGNGIQGMLERVNALHGQIDFDGSKGFQIKGYIPYSI
ncbi:MAG TPA: sensor histidine kinase [Mobilitalea sp.]|nr:sensor histidine kinase [Mobilitalea sp.]